MKRSNSLYKYQKLQSIYDLSERHQNTNIHSKQKINANVKENFKIEIQKFKILGYNKKRSMLEKTAQK